MSMTATTTTAVLPDGLVIPVVDQLPSAPRYLVVAGSWAYGLNHAGSDVDLRGFYMADPTVFLGVGSVPSTFTRTNPDVSLHELGKFARLALAANPTILETLASTLVVESCDVAAELRANVDAFLSDRVRDTHVGYARQQFKKLAERGDSFSSGTRNRAEKHARHLFRAIEQGRRLLTTGELRIEVDDPDELFERARRPVDELLSDAAELLAELDEVPSVLPPQPDVARVERIVVDARLAQLAAR